MTTMNWGMRWAIVTGAAGALLACSGADGKAGSDGQPGESGEQGVQGVQGEQGLPGSMGEAGLTGPAGTAASLPDGGTAPGCDGVALDPPANGAQFQIEMALPAGEESEVCQLVLVTEDLNLNSSTGRYTSGAHHALVYQTEYKDVIPTETVDGRAIDGSQMHRCQTPTALWKSTSVIAGGEGADGSASGAVRGISLPSNVAIKVKKGDVLLLNFHMINTSDEVLDACYKVNLNSIPESQVTTEAGTIFWYNPFIAVPASGESTARMACPISSDISLQTAVSHAHQRMDDYSATLLSGDPEAPGTTTIQTLYTNQDWENPVTKVFDPPMPLTAGQWIDFQCHYTNPEARNVAQGFQTTDEMCMFIGAYWPRNLELEYCARSLTFAGELGRQYGDGTKSGAEFLGCFWNSPQAFFGGGPASSEDRYASQSCIVETCPDASGPIRPYLKCLSDNTDSCTTTCSDASSSFQAVCAMTPSADGGCAEAFGTDGSDGTCAADAGPAAIAACSTAAQQAALTTQCETTLCASAATGDCAANPTGAACAACVGTFTPTDPPSAGGGTNDSCLNSLTFACVGDQATKIGTDCATACFTDCITGKVTSCVVEECLNGVSCKAEYDALAAATCN